MKNNILTLAVAGLLLTTGVQAQEWANFSNITAVTDVEPAGDLLWMSGKGGLVVQNTTTGTKTFYHKETGGLPSNSIEQIVRTSDDVIWVGTYEAGVVGFDGAEWTTYDFPTDLLLYRMKADLNDNLWLQTASGIYKFNTDTHVYTFINSVGGAGWDFNAWDFDITPDNQVLIFTGTKCLVFDAATTTAVDSFEVSDSPVVLGCSPSTVRVYNVDENTYLINNGFDLAFVFKDGSFADGKTGLPDFASVNNILRGTDNKIYAYVDAHAVYTLVDMTWEYVCEAAVFTPYQLLYADGDDFYFNNYTYNSAALVIHRSPTDYAQISVAEYNMQNNSIRGLALDAEGDVHMLSGAGQYVYNADVNDWDLERDVPTLYGAYDLRFANNTFYCVNYGNLIQYFNGTDWTVIPLADGYSSIYIFDYDVTADGTIYFVNDDGVFQYADGETTLLFATPGVSNWGLSIAYDEMRDVLWVGKMDGIVEYDFATQNFIDASDVPALAAGPAINSIEVAPDGAVWFGANNNRAYRYDGTTWEDYTIGEGFGFVISFAWSGTKSYFGITEGQGGVHVYDALTETWTWLSTASEVPMPNDDVNYIAVTSEQELWVAHDYAGISRYTEAVDPVSVIDFQQAALVYPNPVAQTLFMQDFPEGDVQYQIYDMQGRKIGGNSITQNGIDVQTLPAGMYVLQVEKNNAAVFSGTFIKE